MATSTTHDQTSPLVNRKVGLESLCDSALFLIFEFNVWDCGNRKANWLLNRRLGAIARLASEQTVSIKSLSAITSFWTEVARRPIIRSYCKRLTWFVDYKRSEEDSHAYLLLPNLFRLSSIVRLSLTVEILDDTVRRAVTDYIVQLPCLAHLELKMDVESMRAVANGFKRGVPAQLLYLGLEHPKLSDWTLKIPNRIRSLTVTNSIYEDQDQLVFGFIST